MNINSASMNKAIGIGSMVTLGAIGLFCLNPMTGSLASAAESNQVLTPTTVTVTPMIAIGLSQDRFEMEVVPRSEGATAVQAAQLTVNTNNTSGYKIYMHTADGSGNLKNVNQTANITPTADNTKLSDFAENTWGYYFGQAAVSDNSTYHPVGASAGTVIKQANQASTAAEAYHLAIATKIGTTLPAGTYGNVLVISAITNPVEITSMDQIFFMQDITPELCANATMEQQRQLTDTRDGKSYWVAKLKDGNCWMTQNLALDIPAEGLRSSDTDITEDWNSDAKYPPIATTDVIANVDGSGTQAATQALSWNLGKWVTAIPFYNKSCPVTKDISTCENFGYVNVADSEWRGDYSAGMGDFTLPDGANFNGYIAANQSSKTYDAHYLVGNYYNYAAATAGTMVAPGVATGSICPKGWRLPYQRGNDVNKEGVAYSLLLHYGVEDKVTSTGSEANQSFWTDGVRYSAYKAPLYIFPSGMIAAQIYDEILEDGQYRRIFSGNLGLYWSTYAKTILETITFGISQNGPMVPAAANPTFNGNHVRCLVSSTQP